LNKGPTFAAVFTWTYSMMRAGLGQLASAVEQVIIPPVEQAQKFVDVAVIPVTFGASWVAASCIPAVSEAVVLV
jgi:hypothetical protein